MRRSTVKAALYLVLLLSLPPAFGAERIYGDKKPGIKGRYLAIADGVDLSAYRKALVILEPAEIVADKDRPVDTESVRTTSDEMLRASLAASGLFGTAVSSPPLALPEGPVVRVATKLTLEHGSQAMRFWVGAGAGKSKLHVRVDLFDAKTGATLGYFNGYGTGAGLWSMSGGGVQRMARDDFEENYSKLAEYLVSASR